MNSLDALLIARAFREGRGLRRASMCHRRLLERPLAIVLWQIGAEPFSAAALGWGEHPSAMSFAVAGDPRSRDLAFNALLPFARWFNPRFETSSATRESARRGQFEYTRATTFPQVVVANVATASMIGRLGRRLAYLPLDGPNPADPALVRLGRHFLFIERHSLHPGQQIIVPLTELLKANWITAQTDIERASLPALDAFIEPPAGIHGFEAAMRAEGEPVGPIPAGKEDIALEPLVEEFNRRRARRTDPAVIEPLLGPIRAHYRPLVNHAWALLWRCLERERAYPEAPSCQRRVTIDREEYTRHIDWTMTVGHRRTRQTVRQAAMTVRDIEDEQTLVLAEEATDDPIRMIPYLLDGKAVRGRVVGIDRDYQEVANVRAVRRPVVTLACDEACRLARGRRLYWTEHAGGSEWVIHDVDNRPSRFTVRVKASSRNPALPEMGAMACFSIHTTRERYEPRMATKPPWTHVPATKPDVPGPIEEVSA